MRKPIQLTGALVVLALLNGSFSAVYAKAGTLLIRKAPNQAPLSRLNYPIDRPLRDLFDRTVGNFKLQRISDGPSSSRPDELIVDAASAEYRNQSDERIMLNVFRFPSNENAQASLLSRIREATDFKIDHVRRRSRIVGEPQKIVYTVNRRKRGVIWTNGNILFEIVAWVKSPNPRTVEDFEAKLRY